ncbi:MAG: MmcQ/YjbR family DNA-binding protein [Sphingobacteriaceae bacterium]|nr:MAG: MmcQ/YjbR family DNA-binding protein [Sphingobacteriaceae bacterium]
MISTETARQIALALPGTTEHPHFDKQAFKANKRIYATLWEKERLVMVKLSLIDQSVFSSFDSTIIYPVPNKWGLQGCTFIELDKVPHEMLEDALHTAWQTIMLKKK